MLKKWLFLSTFIGIAAVAWTEYRFWSFRNSQRTVALQLSSFAGPAVAAEEVVSEESEPLDVIDLTLLQKQTAEPPFADFAVPEGLPPLAEGHAKSAVGTVEPDVADYRPYSADPPTSGLFSFCRQLAEYLWNRPTSTVEEWELLPIMPRPLYSAQYHPHDSCPYSGGCPYDGGQYRHEDQAVVPASANVIAKPEVKRKQPKLDTMEIRPGDIPADGFKKPF